MIIDEVNTILSHMSGDDQYDRLREPEVYLNLLKEWIEPVVSKMTIKEKLETFRQYFPGEKYDPNFVDRIVDFYSNKIYDFKPTNHVYYTNIVSREDNFFENLEIILSNKHLGIEGAIKKAKVEDYTCKMRSAYCGPMAPCA